MPRLPVINTRRGPPPPRWIITSERSPKVHPEFKGAQPNRIVLESGIAKDRGELLTSICGLVLFDLLPAHQTESGHDPEEPIGPPGRRGQDIHASWPDHPANLADGGGESRWLDMLDDRQHRHYVEILILERKHRIDLEVMRDQPDPGIRVRVGDRAFDLVKTDPLGERGVQ
jgi:hypothetical protein